MMNVYGESFGKAACTAIQGICEEEFHCSDDLIRCKGIAREGSELVIALPFYGTVKGHYLLIISKECAQYLTEKVNPVFAKDLKYSVLCEILNTAVGEAILPLIKEYKDISIFSPIINSCPIEYPEVDSIKMTIKNSRGMEIELYTMIEVQNSSVISEKIQTAVKEVYDGTEIKSQYLEVMAHELKTPLNSVLGFADLLLEEDLSKEQMEMVSSLKLSSEEINSTLNSILEYMSIGQLDKDVEEVQFNLENLISKVLRKAKKCAGEKGLTIKSKLNNTVPHILGDSVKLEKALNALLDNAVKFTNHGEINIDLSSNISEDKIQEIEFKITDTGIGIPGDVLGKITEPFEKVDSSITREHKGIGLGLPICKKLLNNLGSDISIHSEPTRGTCVSFKLKTKLASDCKSYSPYFKGKRAVILSNGDDDQLLSSLNHYGLTVDCFSSLLSFFKNNKQKFDILYLYLEGKEALQAAQIFERNKIADKIVYILDSSDKTYKSQLHKHGAQHFLNLLFNADEVLDISKRVLEYRDKPESLENIKAANLSVLIAEDNIVNQLVIKKVFDLLGCDIDIANDGLEAMQKLEENTFDVVFMDLQMPNLDGLTATKRIRQKEDFNDIPIIALTASDGEKIKQQCLEAGMNGFITKPFKLDKIKKVLNICIQFLNKKNDKENFALID